MTFSPYARQICVRLQTCQDLTGWKAKFELIDTVKEFDDITSKLITINYTAAETADFPIGKTFGTLTIADAEGKVKELVKTVVDIENQDNGFGTGGPITVSLDSVLADYTLCSNKPSINGVVLSGDHDGAHYHLVSQVELDALVARVVALEAALGNQNEKSENPADDDATP